MNHELDAHEYPTVLAMQETLARRFPYFAGVWQRQYDEFGDAWLQALEVDMARFFGDDRERLDQAVYGYGCFALDAMRLQKEFDKTGEYRNKSYAEAASEVYQNEEYMFGLYLPGILISHFLWRHHYLQHIFFCERFVPLIRAHGGDRFFDVGVGTGFYSKEMLRVLPEARGTGVDLSPFSMRHTVGMLESWGFGARYSTELRDIISDPPGPPAPFLVNIEVLEHLEDPQSFLCALHGMLEPGGYGLISAAMRAPNADHIYLYNSVEEVLEQIQKAGFDVVRYIDDPAYEARRPGDSVPRNAAVIVTRS
jgi:2-polyprenyl-3-methyl-5-hydroxy-6-metoxy-1,4-benzoquinol methylase